LERLASLNIFVYSIRLNAFHLIILESLFATCPSLLTTYYEVQLRENKDHDKARPLDVKGLMNETYELLRGGELDVLGRG
jgi:hypothetical protein